MPTGASLESKAMSQLRLPPRLVEMVPRASCCLQETAYLSHAMKHVTTERDVLQRGKLGLAQGQMPDQGICMTGRPIPFAVDWH